MYINDTEVDRLKYVDYYVTYTSGKSSSQI